MIDKPMRADLEFFQEAMENLFDPVSNPNGAFLLNIAENKLSEPLIREYIERTLREEHLPDWVSYYTFPGGHPELCRAWCNFYSHFVANCELKSDCVSFSAGITAVIELSSMVLADKGDVAVFPAPAYPVYSADIGNKARLERFDLKMYNGHSTQRSPLNTEKLDSCLSHIKEQGKTMKLLVLTSPDNPTGYIYNVKELKCASDWCIEHKIHLIVNEVYALSAFPMGSGESYPSFAPIMETYSSPYLHLWYGASKDFCSSGYRLGLLYSHNQELHSAYRNLNGPSMVSNITQWIFSRIWSDMDFLRSFLNKSKTKLERVSNALMECFTRLEIPFVQPEGSLFIWAGFINQLQHFDSEKQLWLAFYREAGLLLTPGDGFGHESPAWYRIVYSSLREEELAEVLERFEQFIRKYR